MGSLTESLLFTPKLSAPYPVFWDVYKHSWDADCVSSIQTEQPSLGWHTGTQGLSTSPVDTHWVIQPREEKALGDIRALSSV